MGWVTGELGGFISGSDSRLFAFEVSRLDLGPTQTRVK